MSVATEHELVELKSEIRSWLKHNKPEKPAFLLPQTFMEVGSEEQLDFLRAWQ